MWESRVVVLCSLTCQAREEMPSLWLYRCACLHYPGQLINRPACLSVNKHITASPSQLLQGHSQALRRPPRHPCSTSSQTHAFSSFAEAIHIALIIEPALQNWRGWDFYSPLSFSLRMKWAVKFVPYFRWLQQCCSPTQRLSGASGMVDIPVSYLSTHCSL